MPLLEVMTAGVLSRTLYACYALLTEKLTVYLFTNPVYLFNNKMLTGQVIPLTTLKHSQNAN